MSDSRLNHHSIVSPINIDKKQQAAATMVVKYQLHVCTQQVAN
jgi:hypothetical protein